MASTTSGTAPLKLHLSPDTKGLKRAHTVTEVSIKASTSTPGRANTVSGAKVHFSPRSSQPTCVVCAKGGPLFPLPCRHNYDIPCLLGLVSAAVRDESLFPPSCCNIAVPASLLKPHLAKDDALRQAYEEKSIEFGTLRRVYCARAPCSRFLGPQIEGKGKGAHGQSQSYLCAGCGTRTCSRCRTEVRPHVLHACRPSAGDELVKSELGRARGWVSCPGCARVVEPEWLACLWMRCACRTAMCALCGKRQEEGGEQKAKEKGCRCAERQGREKEKQKLKISAPMPLVVTPSRPHAVPKADKSADDTLSELPVLPPLPRLARMRQTWIGAPGSPVESLAARRERASAPAQLQTRLRLPEPDSEDETMLTRGIYAQERRKRRVGGEDAVLGGSNSGQSQGQGESKVGSGLSVSISQLPGGAAQTVCSPTDSAASAGTNGRLDVLDAQIDRVLHAVEHCTCAHDWRLEAGPYRCGLCKTANDVFYRCASCSLCICTRCERI